jgi:signal transduction histidine kinase
VIAQLSFLIVAAMLLCDVVMIRFAERDLVRARVAAGRMLARALEGKAAALGGKPAALGEAARDLLEEGGFDSATLVQRDGDTIAQTGTGRGPVPPLHRTSAAQAARTGREQVEFLGRTWAVIWFGPESVLVSVPARIGGRNGAGISVHGSLAPLYENLRASQKVVLLYILLDTVILALAGMALLSRIVVRPVRKLLHMTREYRGGDFLVPLEATSGSEIRQLSRSLSHMVQRLDENREALKEHIASLEQANEELRKAQDEIIRSEKLASVGRLAAGIAHEIGNPVGIILGYLELSARRDTSEEERVEFLRRAEGEVTKVSRIIRTLLDFSRASENLPEEVSVHGLIRDTLEMLTPQKIMRGVRLELALEAARDGVFSDAGRLQQVFLNVLMNAGDALNENGGGATSAIRIETRSEEGWIEVRISDNGPGIPPGELSQVFDPFYTTKDPGKGTGLGLSVSHRIVEDLDGTIRVNSAENQGTEVIVRLPLDGAGE